MKLFTTQPYLFDEVRSRVEADLQALDCHPDDPTSMAVSSLLRALGKKFVGERLGVQPTAEERRDSAANRFLMRNDQCAEANLKLDAGFSHLSEPTQEILGTATDILTNMLARLDESLSDPSELLSFVRCGPGTVLGNHWFDFYGKLFHSQMPCPSEQAAELLQTIQGQNWLRFAAEINRSVQYGDPYVQENARWSNVPKTNETDRSIVIQSNGGSLLALALGDMLSAELTRIGYSLVEQPDRNRQLAYIGSLDESQGPNAPSTIDLSDASDTVSLALTRKLLTFLPNIWKCVCFIRDRNVEVLGTVYPLHMVSTMGCGFTFPLQTFIYLSLVKACYRYLRVPESAIWRGGVLRVLGVFGDDIIVKASVYPLVLSTLTELGMTVNGSKSFCDGPFRESCGTDWYRGRNIRGVYIKKLDTPEDIVDLVNRLADWSAAWVPLTSTLRYLMGILKPVYRNVVPPWEDERAGIRVPKQVLYLHQSAHNEDILAERLSKALRIKLFVERDDCVYRPNRGEPQSRDLREPTGATIVLNDYPEIYILDDSSRPVRTVEFKVRNWASYLLSVVSGGVFGPSCMTRSDTVRYNRDKFAVTHNWDIAPPTLGKSGFGELEIRQQACLLTAFGKPMAWSARLQRLANVWSLVGWI